MNNGFIESTITTPVTLATNSSTVTFQNDDIRTRSANCCGWLQHTEGSPIYKVIEGGYYDVELTATLFSATAGTGAIGLYVDGVLDPSTVRAVTLVGDSYETASFDKKLKVCCRADSTVSVGAVPGIVTPGTGALVDTIPFVVYSATFSIEKEA